MGERHYRVKSGPYKGAPVARRGCEGSALLRPQEERITQVILSRFCDPRVLLVLSGGDWPTINALTSGGIFSGLLGTVSTLLTGLDL